MPNLMAKHRSRIARFGALPALLITAAFLPALAQQAGTPNFAQTTSVGWVGTSDTLLPPALGPGPVLADPAHPRISNAVAAETGKQPTFHFGDARSPILQPWAQEALRKRDDEILGGKPGYTRAVSCWPLGVPAFLLGPVQPYFFVQTPKEVLIIWQEDHQVRHVYMNVPHSARVTPSWYGESIGHYEGDTLVVDTIGLSEKTYVDHFRTPHTDKLHVVERFRMIDGGKMLEVNIHVDDPGTFTSSWNAVQRLRHVEDGPMLEGRCGENNRNYFNQQVEPMAVAEKPDF